MEQKIRELLTIMWTEQKKYTYAEIKALLDLEADYSSSKLGKAIRKIAEENNFVVEMAQKKSSRYLIVKKKAEVVSFKKDKTIVSFLDDENNIIFSFDYNKEEAENTPTEYIKDRFVLEGGLGIQLAILLREYLYLQHIPEFVWSYFDLIDVYKAYKLRGISIVKGYVNFLRENNLLIDDTTAEAFRLKDKGFPPEAIIKIIKAEESHYSSLICLWQCEEILNWTEYQRLMKIALITVKNGYAITQHILAPLINLCNIYGYQYLDTNRDVNFNIKNYKNIAEEKRNEVLEERLSKLNFLNGKIIGDYVITVPKNRIDLIDEGKQQNNCVGSYYNNSILEGRDLIYFLRKASAPNKSVVTCRYSIATKKTVEHRIKNNKLTSEKQNEIIEIVDEAINKILL